MDHFYVTCPSNSSMDMYPNNTLAHFTMKLNNALELFGDYEVGLSEIQYPMSWSNVRDDQNSFVLRYKKKVSAPGRRGKEVHAIRRVPSGYYPSVEKLLKTMTDLATKESFKALGIALSYDQSTRRVTISTKEHSEKEKNRGSLKLKHDIARLLGFEKETLIKRNRIVTSPFAALPSGGFHNMFVYSDIVEQQFVGDVQAPLLRILPVHNQSDEIMLSKTFSKVYYLPVAKKRISEIDFKITDDTGRPVGFNYGKVVLVLHFRRKKV